MKDVGREGKREGERKGGGRLHMPWRCEFTDDFLLRLKNGGIDFIGAPISQISSHAIFYVLI